EISEKFKDKYTVKIDHRDESAGSKFYYWELRGVPIRIEIGPRDVDNHQMVLVKRHDGKKLFVKENDLVNVVTQIAKDYTREIKEKSVVDFESQIECVYEKDAAITAINNGKIVCCGFCSIDMEGEHCAEIVEKDIGAFVRGRRVDDEKHEFATCLICGKPATCTVYIAKSY
ncbi:MAG: His/Gly/Thr/Pro-type tRNA ligase C-terminal domain-containing protein, partial [Candidatus Lokiarchaeota archaeon]|nr:His/Gly/Thr/Pro-type tRNA ligase C-terminal domain-containing protein [Candidatus Lokiarchaeota archaeon]